ncbi:Laccase-8 [Camellia lanceoleosa]|uniref:Laccase-8 n=1 Tax=Camellia lanceoleosa TaxID=1840588 RepID=A0ACC0H321_9ERIC|nr:Laccase-8 [Camellia lanceoleosa]
MLSPSMFSSAISINALQIVNVARGKTYLLRVINAAMNNQFFFKIANHKMTVVAVDATYTTPMVTNFIVIAPGQTIDALLTADQPAASYYMAAHTYISSEGVPDATTSTTGIIVCENAMSSTPRMSVLLAFNDTTTAYKFYISLTALVNAPHWVPIPLNVDEHMFVIVNLGLIPCEAGSTYGGPLGDRLAASLNNASFEFNTKLSMMEAFFNNVDGIYTTDFPDQPPLVFDYTNSNNNFNRMIIMTSKSTKVKKLKFNSIVEMVLQNTASLGIESHHMHLHGFNFHVLAQGFGNYDPINDPKKFNLLNPRACSTITVPTGHYRKCVWLMHCHMDIHVPWGLSMAFEAENGPTPSTRLPPPPQDLLKC